MECNYCTRLLAAMLRRVPAGCLGGCRAEREDLASPRSWLRRVRPLTLPGPQNGFVRPHPSESGGSPGRRGTTGPLAQCWHCPCPGHRRTGSLRPRHGAAGHSQPREGSASQPGSAMLAGCEGDCPVPLLCFGAQLGVVRMSGMDTAPRLVSWCRHGALGSQPGTLTFRYFWGQRVRFSQEWAHGGCWPGSARGES